LTAAFDNHVAIMRIGTPALPLVLTAMLPLAAAHTGTRLSSADYAVQGSRVVQALAAGQYGAVEARLDARMRTDLPQARLAALWRELIAHTGPFTGVTATAVAPEPGGYHVVAMTCAFRRAREGDALVTFDSTGRIAGLYFGPQPTEAANEWTAPRYADRRRFREVAVTVSDGPWHLPGTLTLPNGEGPFPAVVLVPGSPPLDQDATLGPNKLFKDLAWGLATRGIAVLRYTKRTHQFGAGLGGGAISSFSLREEVTDDARAAAAVLSRRTEIDQHRIYLLGHSLGGLAVPAVAAEDPGVAGVILMGAPSGDLLALLLERVERAASQGGEEGRQAAAMIPVFRKLEEGGFTEGEIADVFGQPSPVGYWLNVRDHEAGPAVAKLRVPAMVLLAGHDAEVPASELDKWKSALAGHGSATVKLYPGLFHLFMPSTSTQAEDAPEDWSRPGHASPEVVDDIASWIRQRPTDPR